MWISEDFLAFLKTLAFAIGFPLAIAFAFFISPVIVNLIELIIGAARLRILELFIKAVIITFFAIAIGGVAIEGLSELYHYSNIWITLVIASIWAIVPVLWIISKVRQIKGTGRSYDL